MTKDIRVVVEQFDNGITLRDSEGLLAIVVPDNTIEKTIGGLLWAEIDKAMANEKTAMAEVSLTIEVEDEH